MAALLRPKLVALSLLCFSLRCVVTRFTGFAIWSLIGDVMEPGVFDPVTVAAQEPFEFSVPGVYTVIVAAHKLHGSDGDDCMALESSLESLLNAVSKLQPAATTYPVTRRVVVRALQNKVSVLEGCGGTFRAPFKRVLHTLRIVVEAGRHAGPMRAQQLQILKAGGAGLCQLAAANRLKVVEGCEIDKFGDRRMVAEDLTDVFDEDSESEAKAHASGDTATGGRPTPAVIANLSGKRMQEILRTLAGGDFEQLWMRPKELRSAPCHTRAVYLKKHDVNFYTNPYALTDDGEKCSSGCFSKVCVGEMHMTVLRSPVSRALHHVRTLNALLAQVGLTAVQPANFRELAFIAPQVADNLYIRSLLGDPLMTAQFGGVLRQHLFAAKWQLLQFDVVGVTEAAEKSAAVVGSLLGWQGAEGAIKAVEEEGKEPKLPPELKQELAQGLMIASYNLDFELYRFANTLLELDHMLLSKQHQEGGEA